MKVESFTASDGYLWRYRRFRPPAKPIGHIICLHGIQSHGGWYEFSCRQLGHAGFLVDFLDRRGSGLNPVSRGDTPGFRRLLADVNEFVDDTRKAGSETSGLPTILLGISWGAKLSVGLLRRYSPLVTGLILVCPGFFPRVRLSLRERLSVLYRRVIDPTHLSPVPLNDPELFTATPRWLDFLRTDELAVQLATARFFVESVRLDAYVRISARAVSCPVLLLLAGKDRIIDNARTRDFAKHFATDDLTVIEYPEAHHTLEFEPDPNHFVRDMVDWLTTRSR